MTSSRTYLSPEILHSRLHHRLHFLLDLRNASFDLLIDDARECDENGSRALLGLGLNDVFEESANGAHDLAFHGG